MVVLVDGWDSGELAWILGRTLPRGIALVVAARTASPMETAATAAARFRLRPEIQYWKFNCTAFESGWNFRSWDGLGAKSSVLYFDSIPVRM